MSSDGKKFSNFGKAIGADKVSSSKRKDMQKAEKEVKKVSFTNKLKSIFNRNKK